MSKKTGTPEKSFPSPADTSDAHVALSDELTIVVGHMKKSNDFVRQTNKELIKLNRSVARQNRLLSILALSSLLLLVGLSFSLYEQRRLGFRLDVQLVQQTTTNTQLSRVVTKLGQTYDKAKETKDAIDEQPKITVKPADATDPTSRPVLIVQPNPKSKGKKGDTSSKLKGVEIPFDREKLKK